MERYKVIATVMEELERLPPRATFTDAAVYSFYERNAFYLVVYDVFTDVRLTFAPPTSLGKFGADSDNWMGHATPTTSQYSAVLVPIISLPTTPLAISPTAHATLLRCRWLGLRRAIFP